MDRHSAHASETIPQAPKNNGKKLPRPRLRHTLILGVSLSSHCICGVCGDGGGLAGGHVIQRHWERLEGAFPLPPPASPPPGLLQPGQGPEFQGEQRSRPGAGNTLAGRFPADFLALLLGFYCPLDLPQLTGMALRQVFVLGEAPLRISSGASRRKGTQGPIPWPVGSPTHQLGCQGPRDGAVGRGWLPIGRGRPSLRHLPEGPLCSLIRCSERSDGLQHNMDRRAPGLPNKRGDRTMGLLGRVIHAGAGLMMHLRPHCAT